MSVNFEEIGQRLAVAVRESPGNNSDDPEEKSYYQKLNGQRIWEIWTQCRTFDPRDRQLQFSIMSGLPTGVVTRYMTACQKYDENRATERIKKSRRKGASRAA